jgi:hypothetical protein
VTGRVAICTILLEAASLAVPALASAHGILGRAYLPVPAWLFAWAAALVLAASFAGLAALWSAPRLEVPREHRLLRYPRWIEPLLGLVGIGLFAVVVVCGLDGVQTAAGNLAPTAVFVVFWVAVPIASVLLGDVFAPLNPWRALARGVAWVAACAARSGARVSARTNPPGSRVSMTPGGRSARWGEPLPYPARLGRWPAVAGIIGFAWLELVYVDRQRPSALAILAVAYAGLQVVGMSAFGIRTWTDRGDAFAVAFNLFGRMSPLRWRGGALSAAAPLSGLTGWQCLPGTIPLLCAMIGATTFDGAANGPVWRAIAKPLARGFGHLGLAPTPSLEITNTIGLLLCIALCGGLYLLGIKGMGSVSSAHPSRRLARSFVHSLVPIAFGYLLAHYFSLLVTQGQAVGYLISDPLGHGSNIFGTASFQVNYKLFSTAAIWYVQVVALVLGHVSGLALSHDRALVVYGDAQDAAVSQRWMLVVMVSFTCLGLWLLSAVNA